MSVFVVGGFDVKADCRKAYERRMWLLKGEIAEALLDEKLGKTPEKSSADLAAELTHLIKTWELMLAYDEGQD